MPVTMLTDHFSRDELACRHCGEMLFTDRALAMLEDLRGAYERPMLVTSGYRCVEYNRNLTAMKMATTGDNSPHSFIEDDNIAVDVRVHGWDAFALVQVATARGWTGIGISQRGKVGSRFVHLDRIPARSKTHPRPWIWSY